LEIQAFNVSTLYYFTIFYRVYARTLRFHSPALASATRKGNLISSFLLLAFISRARRSLARIDKASFTRDALIDIREHPRTREY